MSLEYREGGFAVTEVAVIITEAETRGELSQVAFADRLTTQRAQTLSTGISPVHQDEFHMRPPPEKIVVLVSRRTLMSCSRRANRA